MSPTLASRAVVAGASNASAATIAAGVSPAAVAAPSRLWRRVCAGGMRVVAVMGMTKNTGKTVALNHLLAAAAAEHVDIGLTSIGRDGEPSDAVFSFPKPPVRVWPGTVVATARDTLVRAKVRTRLLGGAGVASPMGEIVLAKVLDAGEMEVAGASRNADQQRVIEQLRRCGAAQVFIDGALGRSAHASPALADGVILATGAAVGGGLADVLRKTRERLALLAVPEVAAGLRAPCAPLFEAGGVGLWAADGGALWQAPIASLNAAAALLEHDSRAVATVAATGAVGRRLWSALLTLAERHAGLNVLVADGTRLFVESADLAALAARGGRLQAWRRIHLVGLTTNPFSPLGAHLDAAMLLAAARTEFAGHTVCDVVLEAEPDAKRGTSEAVDHGRHDTMETTNHG